MRMTKAFLTVALTTTLFLAGKAQALGCWVCPHAYDTCYYYAETNYQAWNDGCYRTYPAGAARNQCLADGAVRYSNDIAQCEADREQCYDWCDSVEKPPRDNCPIVIDLEDHGVRFTSAQQGVAFDIDGNGGPDAIAWTDAAAGDGFLVLDRNHNGVIDDGRELFGDSTPQALSPEPNGFLALQLLDGNADGYIRDDDAVFSSLRIWVDANHDGISQEGELTTLAQHGIASIDLDYRESRRKDRYGNELRFRSRVRLEDGSQTDAIDVFFQEQ